MTKIKLLFLFIVSSVATNAQNPYKVNIFEDLGVTIETAIKRHCTGVTQGVITETNLLNTILPIDNIYHFDLGLGDGTRYYKVTYSANYVSDDAIDIDLTPNFGESIADLCNSVSWKYHRVILLGSSLLQAQNNFCSNQTVNSTREKLNLKIGVPLNVGEVYFMDFGLGANYYLIDSSGYGSGDSDYDLDTTTNSSVFSYISHNSLNCPAPDLQAIQTTTNFNQFSDVYPGRKIAIGYVFKNIGDLPSTNSQIAFYISKDDNTLDSNDKYLGTKLFNSLAVNEIQSGTFVSNVPNNTITGSYYVIMKIIMYAGGSESNLNNNISSSEIFFVTENSSKFSTNKGTIISSQPKPLNEVFITYYSIDIYNFQGQKVISKEVASIEEENKLIQSLSSGLYIVKSKNKTYKISKN
jgi:hypothetical protein